MFLFASICISIYLCMYVCVYVCMCVCRVLLLDIGHVDKHDMYTIYVCVSTRLQAAGYLGPKLLVGFPTTCGPSMMFVMNHHRSRSI